MNVDEAYAAAGRTAGCPPDQMQNFEGAGIVLQPRELAASAALDYGFTHYTVCLLGCTDADGNVFVVDEHAGRVCSRCLADWRYRRRDRAGAGQFPELSGMLRCFWRRAYGADPVRRLE